MGAELIRIVFAGPTVKPCYLGPMLSDRTRARGGFRLTRLAAVAMAALLAFTACTSENQAWDFSAGGQELHQLQVKSVSAAAGSAVYELDQRRGALFPTSALIAHGSELVTLPWGVWDIISTDPVRAVRQGDLSAPQAQCPLSARGHHFFHAGPRWTADDFRLSARNLASEQRALIFGKQFAIASAGTDTVALPIHSVSPERDNSAGLWRQPMSMPEPLRTWYSDLNVPPESVAPVVDDDAFLDFASCYLQRRQRELVHLDPYAASEQVIVLVLPNGQHAVLSHLGDNAEPDDRRLDSKMFEIDRDVLHFGVVAASRHIRLTESNIGLWLSKRYFGLERPTLSASEHFSATPEGELSDVMEAVVKDQASTEVGWKLAIVELLFNEQDRLELWNQIFTGSGDVVLIDHTDAEPFATEVPCALRDLPWIVDASKELKDAYQARDYEGFSQLVRAQTKSRIKVDNSGRILDLMQSYVHVLESGALLPSSLKRRLQWILEHRDFRTESVVEAFFHQKAKSERRDIGQTGQSGVCLFYERIRWVHDHERLPTGDEGVAIMQQCRLKPEASCRLTFP